MVHCRKCSVVNPPGGERCKQCGAKLLPGEGVLDRLGTLVAAIIAAGVSLGIAYLTSKAPADLPDCLPTSPATWLLVGVVSLISGIVATFRKTPLYTRYLKRAQRHLELDPEQALADLTMALETAPEKQRAGLLQERAKLYAKLGFETEATRDRLDYTFQEGAYETGSGITSLVGGDKESYVSARAKDERQQMVAEGKVKALGYCKKCGRVVELTPKLRCPQHSSPKPRDVKFVLPDEVGEAVEAVAEEHKETSRKRRNWQIVIGLVLGIPAILCLVSVVLSGVINRISGATATPTTETVPSTATQRAVSPSGTPTAVPDLVNPFSSDQVACFGHPEFGLTCLGEDGWETYPVGRVQEWDLRNMVACPGGRVVIGLDGGMAVLENGEWSVHETEAFRWAEAIACDAEGGYWAGHYDGVSHFDGLAWTTYGPENFGSGEFVNQVRDIAIGPDGMVWAATANSIVRFDGKDWEVFEEGKGFSSKLFFEAILVDSGGGAWAVHTGGMHRFDGQVWKRVPGDRFTTVRCVAIDRKDRIWVGTSRDLRRFQDGKWKIYRAGPEELSSADVLSLGFDERDRVWVGTTYGLSILDSKRWSSYYMHNSDLLDNLIEGLLVLGEGPAQPEGVDKPFGSISGRARQLGEPVASKRVEVCVEDVGAFQFFGETPCAGQPLVRTVTTDAEGNFIIPDLPPGRYYLTLELSDTRWLPWKDSETREEQVLVLPGEETVVNIR